MASSGSKRRRSSSGDVEQRSSSERIRGLPPLDPASSRSGRRDIMLRELVEGGLDVDTFEKAYYRIQKEKGDKQCSSDLSSFNGWFRHQAGTNPTYLCYRPQHAVPPVPVILLFEPLSTFADNLEKFPIKDEDLAFAQKFWDDVHSSEYINRRHDDVVQRMVGELDRYSKERFIYEYKLLGKSKIDGVGMSSKRFCVWLEYKAEPGESGDPYFQVLDYALKSDSEPGNKGVQTYGIAICVLGPHLQVLAVTIVGGKVWADPLGTVQCYGGLQALEATARVWAAVRQFLMDYREVEGKCRADPVPWPLKVHGDDVQRMEGKSLIYLYKNKQGEQELAKFVQTYCEAAHKAWMPYAPELRGISTIAGDWKLVRMELLSGWSTVAKILGGPNDPSQIKKSITEAVKKGHDGGFVHGDVRMPNILVRAGAESTADGFPAYEVKLLDFDWAGTDNVAKYPTRLNKAVEWPAGAAYGALISKEHDFWHLEQQLK